MQQRTHRESIYWWLSETLSTCRVAADTVPGSPEREHAIAASIDLEQYLLESIDELRTARSPL